MKIQTVILLLFTTQLVLCQKNFEQVSNKLFGHWYNTWETTKTSKTKKGIYYQKDSTVSKGTYKFGRNLYFNKDGTFTDRYVAPCGIDGGIHQYDGKWKLIDKDVIEIYDLKEKYNKANIYPIKKGHTMVVLEKGLFKIHLENKFLLRLEIIKDYETYVEKSNNNIQKTH